MGNRRIYRPAGQDHAISILTRRGKGTRPQSPGAGSELLRQPLAMLSFRPHPAGTGMALPPGQRRWRPRLEVPGQQALAAPC